VLYPQNGDRIVTIVSMTSLHLMYYHHKSANTHGDPHPHLMHGSLGPRESISEQHLDRFSRFRRFCSRPTNTQTTLHAAFYVTHSDALCSMWLTREQQGGRILTLSIAVLCNSSLILPTAALPFSSSGFTTWISQTVYCYFWAYLFSTFSFSVFTLFSCRFLAVDYADLCWLSSAR